MSSRTHRHANRQAAHAGGWRGPWLQCSLPGPQLQCLGTRDQFQTRTPTPRVRTPREGPGRRALAQALREPGVHQSENHRRRTFR